MAELALAARQRTDPVDRIAHGALLLVAAVLVLLLAAPLAALLAQSVEDAQGRFVGLANFADYLHTPALAQSLWNSI